ncbi:hypothetical protein JHN59_32070 [Streptomyces sp. MBT49]|uniref:Mom family adenine methylcarbamoylation protein n=1 Tax=Streptomyces sp. MBT49 TaxID=1488380 RepID=UPI0019095C10|nr:hypothetical protein [Streptomyces sp. MBT49]MBK3629375.1 hypothetical protein [Streptomyces sp. MBT49]
MNGMPVMPSAGELRAMVTGDPRGYAQRWSFGVPSWRHASEGGFRRARYEVVRIDEQTARRYVTSQHYLSGWPAAIQRFGMLDTEAEAGPDDQAVHGHVLVGAVVLASPMNERVLTVPFPGLAPYAESAELARLIVSPSVPANGETFLVSRSLRLAAESGLRAAVSFADPMPRRRVTGEGVVIGSPGHLGIVYQALGARFTGRGTARSLCFLPDGSVLSARSKAKVTGREAGSGGVVRRLELLGARPLRPEEEPARWLAEILPAIGARAARHPGNLRYLLPAARTRAERSRTVFGMPSLPYPKWADDRRPA